MNNFSKRDLRTGMKVVTRSNNKYLVIMGWHSYDGEILDVLLNLRNSGGWCDLSSYGEDLTVGCQEDYTIDKVMSPNRVTSEDRTGSHAVVFNRNFKERKAKLQNKLKDCVESVRLATEEMRKLKAEIKALSEE